jgi:HlyD family secretion protein
LKDEEGSDANCGHSCFDDDRLRGLIRAVDRDKKDRDPHSRWAVTATTVPLAVSIGTRPGSFRAPYRRSPATEIGYPVLKKPTRYLLAIVVLVLLFFETATLVGPSLVRPRAAVLGSPSTKTTAIPPARPQTRHVRTIRGAGLVETKQDNLPIGTLVAGVVSEVYVKRGDAVKKGDPLFRLDDRDFRTQLALATANLGVVEAQLDRLMAAPQQGDIATSEAAVEEAKARFNDAEISYRRSEALFERHVESAQDRDRERYSYFANKATLVKMEADLRRLKVSWDKDQATSRAAVTQARSQVEGIQVNLGRLVVRAAAAGRVVSIHVRPGQFAGAAWNEPLVILGDTRELLLRVDIDEPDLPYFTPDAKAIATLKGRPQVRFPLTYSDTEPSIISRSNSTGSRADQGGSRVLPVLYALPNETPVPLYVGQELDVYIESAKPPEGVVLDADPATAKIPFEDEGPTPVAEPRSKSPHRMTANLQSDSR